ncbi:MAG: hypothetical protein J5824_06620 [Lachnospiraceae bacterium]|nr:hypothetical protein [Lachnospiraceae bacterium]
MIFRRKKNAVFEDAFTSAQTEMVSSCLDYIEGKGDSLFIFASNEGKAIHCDYFYNINGRYYKKHKLPKGYKTDIPRQKQCLMELSNTILDLVSICQRFDKPMPTEIKIRYDVKNNRLKADYQYSNVYCTTSDKYANDIFDEWFNAVLGNNDK